MQASDSRKLPGGRRDAQRRNHIVYSAREVVRYAILLVASIAALYPLWWLITVALKSQADYVQSPLGLPASPTLSNFVAILTDDTMQSYLVNSVLVVGAAVPIATITSVAAGYALARLWGRTGIAILVVFLFSLLIPLPIIVIPLLVTVTSLGIDSGIVRLIFVYSVAVMGFAILTSRAFFRSIPGELREAARLEGCSEFQVFRRIMVPLARSPITLIAIVSFLYFWNEFFLAAVLVESPNDRTLPLGLIRLQGEYSSDWPKLAAALLISTVPTFVLYAVFQGRIANQFSRSTTQQ